MDKTSLTDTKGIANVFAATLFSIHCQTQRNIGMRICCRLYLVDRLFGFFNGPFPLSDKILKKIEIGKNITIA